jgi:hypothetical protein
MEQTKLTKSQINKLSDLVAIKRFFSLVNDPVTIDELKALTDVDKAELGQQARDYLLTQAEE